MNELEIKYKHALMQLGNAFDAIFALNARIEVLTAELEALKKAQKDKDQAEGDME